MFCQCIFNKKGKIIDKAGTVEGIELKSDNINDLFKEVGIEDKEWKIGKEYDAKHSGKRFKCVATILGDDFQFVGLDITNVEKYKTQLETQSRISDLNMNRLLNTLEELRESKEKLKIELETKSKLIASTNHKIREALNAVTGLIEILKETETSEQKELFTLLDTSSKELLELVDSFETE